MTAWIYPLGAKPSAPTKLKLKVMRAITSQALSAFVGGYSFSKSNMNVTVEPNVTIMALHGNRIAYKYNDPENTLSITNAGWQSNTTKERLNSLPNVSICQKNFVWYLNGKEWDGSLVDVLPSGEWTYVSKETVWKRTA